MNMSWMEVNLAIKTSGFPIPQMTLYLPLKNWCLKTNNKKIKAEVDEIVESENDYTSYTMTKFSNRLQVPKWKENWFVSPCGQSNYSDNRTLARLHRLRSSCLYHVRRKEKILYFMVPLWITSKLLGYECFRAVK